jgi:membrane protein implicated in regulation of membrane protease activity
MYDLLTHTPTSLTWIGVGLALLLAELVAPGVFLMWIGLAAIGTGGAVTLGLDGFAPQVVCFAALSAAGIALGLRLRRPPERRINMPESGLVGRTAHALVFDGREGRVRLGDSDWPARLVHGAAPPAKDGRLRVVGVSGVVLLVQPMEN